MAAESSYQKICPCCGKPFTARNGRSIYCSPSCANKAKKLQHRRDELIREQQRVLDGQKAELRTKDYLSISEAARLLGVSRPTLYKRIESGELKVV